MFVAAVFTIARTLKWPKYPSRGMDKDMQWNITPHKKKQNCAICRHVDGIIDCRTE